MAGTAKRIYYFCNTIGKGTVGCECFDGSDCVKPEPSPVPGKLKAVFLLELSNSNIQQNEINLQTTLKYYWLNYPNEFSACPIVDTKGSLENTISLLDKYKSLGFTNFIGFNSVEIYIGVLPWFNMNANMTGFTSLGTTNLLSIPKNIFCMAPNNISSLLALIPQLADVGSVTQFYFIYKKGSVIAQEFIYFFQQAGISFLTYEATSDNLTTSALTAFYESGYKPDVVDPQYVSEELCEDLTENFINLFGNGLTFPGKHFNIDTTGSPLIPQSAWAELSEKYNVVNFQGLCSSVLYQNGYNKLKSEIYNIYALNTLQSLNQTQNNSINNTYSHSGVLQFDPVSRETLYASIKIQTWVGNRYFNTIIYVNDPYLGPYSAFITPNQNPINTDIIPINNVAPFKNAIALFELSVNPNVVDPIYRDTLHYCWYENPAFPKFPIIDTEGNLIKTINLLEFYYGKGYRIFLGFSRSTVVAAVKSWFDNHPDAVAISLWSTATSLKIKKNIYRLTPSDDTIVRAVLPNLLGKTVYYIYTKDELATVNVLEILQSTPTITLKSFGVEKDNSNLTVANLQNFFSGATSENVTLLYILDEQPYFNLYESGLTFPGNQYDIVNTQLPIISGFGRVVLNNKLYYIQNTYPNTSLLWRENADYLTKKYKVLTDSAGVLNAINMIDYFLKAKNIALLGSHSAVLEFNRITNDVEYPSFLFRLYNGITDTFDKNSLFLDDPLLGNFYATFNLKSQ
jgi:hypothetical protein